MSKFREFIKAFLGNKKAVVAVVVFVVIVGLLFWRSTEGNKEQPQVQTAQVERGTIVSSVSASGTVVASHLQNVTTQASGVVKKVYVSDGEGINRGQKIAGIELDQQGQQKQAQAYSSYLSAKSSLALAETSYWTLQSAMFSANQKFINDAVARDLSENDPTYIQQNADWLAAEAKFNNNQTDIEKSKASLSSAWLSYQLASSIISAPSSGVVTNLTIAEGMQIGSSGTSEGANQRVATIKIDGKSLVSVNISEIDVPYVQVGQKASVTLDSIIGMTFSGTIVTVDRLGSTTSGVTNYPALIQLDTSSEQILPNMAATANIIVERKSDVLIVPSNAVQSQGDQSFVLIIMDGNQQNAPIETGISSDTHTEIVSGLEEGDEVVTGSSTSQTQSGQSGSSPFGGFGGSGGFGGAVRLPR